jgi:hypothetical protein
LFSLLSKEAIDGGYMYDLSCMRLIGEAGEAGEDVVARLRLNLSFKSVRIESSIISLDGFQFDGLDTQRQLKIKVQTHIGSGRFR